MDKGNIIFLFFTIYLSCHLFGFPFSFSLRIFLHFFLFSSLSFILFSLLSSVNSSFIFFSAFFPPFPLLFFPFHLSVSPSFTQLFHVAIFINYTMFIFLLLFPSILVGFPTFYLQLLFLTTFKFYKSIHKFQQMWQLPLCKQEPLYLTD